MRSRAGSELSDDEKAVSPLMGTCLQYSLDFCLHGRSLAKTWARGCPPSGLSMPYTSDCGVGSPAAFEQGALPSLLMMPGIAPVFSLPGDGMFQATEVVKGYQRPAIMHAYGVPRLVWKDPWPRLHQKDGSLWLLPCSEQWTNHQCGPVLGSVQLSVQPLILRSCLQYSQKERNCSCSRAGNSGIQPVYRAVPCLNGLLESKWSMGQMGSIPRLI